MAVDPRAQANAPNITYEFYMLVRLADVMLAKDVFGGIPGYGGVLKNAAIEAYLIHVRVVWDFLCRDDNKPRAGSPHGDDVRAVHFFDTDAQWRRIRPTQLPYLSTKKDRLNKTLAHLSYSRAPKERWDYRAILSDIMTLWRPFWSALPAIRKAWFKRPGRSVNDVMKTAEEILKRHP